MNRIITICAAVLMTASVFAQSPEKMSYQAVIRDSADGLVTNTQVGMQISILQGTASGSAVYVETQTPTTNVNGLVSLEIGSGTTSADFTNIDWANGPYFIKTETDPSGGTTYSITGTSQLMSVPYALYAKSAESVTFPPSYTLGLNADLGGYVFFVTPDGNHGLVAATQDQSRSSYWYDAQNVISNPANYDANGKKFTDWRLPTKYELNEMYKKKNAIGGFASGVYWCSTEVNIYYAWIQFFKDGTQDESFEKDTYQYVRAVRAF